MEPPALDPAPPPARPGSRRRLALFDARFTQLLALAWLAAAFLYWLLMRDALALWTFSVPDDELRLLQVRDFLAGQSWFDVSQHRLNPPDGAAMHWSRLVDLPIAAIILLGRPLLGSHGAEALAITLVPLLTLAAAMAAVALLAGRLLPARHALLAAALAPLTIGAITQMRVMRIDHHGWQIVLGVLATAALLDRHPRRAGIIAGAAAALWMHISLEGLPLTAVIGAAAALKWLFDPVAERQRFAWFGGALVIASLALFALTKAPAEWAQVYCDAISPVQLATLVAAAAGAAASVRFATHRSFAIRLLALGGTGIASLAAYASGAPACRGGAFATLDPFVYEHWYLTVKEGLPLWVQDPVVAGSMIGYPLVGLAGAVLALRQAGPDRRSDWLTYLGVLAAATLLAVFVCRTANTASLIALPGGVVLIQMLLNKTAQLHGITKRTVAAALAVMLVMPVAPIVLSAAIAGGDDEDARTASRCDGPAGYAALNRLPPGILLSNIDRGPALLVNTHHRVVASGHHRNGSGMHDAIATFLGSPAEAHAVLRRRKVDYLVICPALPETRRYVATAPNGFLAQLPGAHFPWLVRQPLPGSAYEAWRVLPGSSRP